MFARHTGRSPLEAAATALPSADPDWLAGLITRRVPLVDFASALDAGPADIKVALDLST